MEITFSLLKEKYLEYQDKASFKLKKKIVERLVDMQYQLVRTNNQDKIPDTKFF